MWNFPDRFSCKSIDGHGSFIGNAVVNFLWKSPTKVSGQTNLWFGNGKLYQVGQVQLIILGGLYKSIVCCHFLNQAPQGSFPLSPLNTLLTMVICNLLMYLMTIILFQTKSALQKRTGCQTSPIFNLFFPSYIRHLWSILSVYYYDNRFSPSPMYKSKKKKKQINTFKAFNFYFFYNNQTLCGETKRNDMLVATCID